MLAWSRRPHYTRSRQTPLLTECKARCSNDPPPGISIALFSIGRSCHLKKARITPGRIHDRLDQLPKRQGCRHPAPFRAEVVSRFQPGWNRQRLRSPPITAAFVVAIYLRTRLPTTLSSMRERAAAAENRDKPGRNHRGRAVVQALPNRADSLCSAEVASVQPAPQVHQRRLAVNELLTDIYEKRYFLGYILRKGGVSQADITTIYAERLLAITVARQQFEASAAKPGQRT
jgi:hypothetical protein